MDDNYVAIGRIKRAVGLRGDVLVRAFSSIDSYARAGCVFLKKNGDFIKVPIRIVRLKGAKDAVCHLDGIDNRTQAEELKGQTVYQAKSLLPRDDANEYYWYELKGLRVINSDSQELGTIKAIIEAGAQDILVVRAKDQEILIPMVDEYIRNIDTEAGICSVDIPQTLIDATLSRVKRSHKKK
ncbi:MAG: 16S rRNA processing protein RimM [Thermodesulfobacteria bacterium]|nr:16S rRNA processing protein RimM [Thermodesulfobacteriota bacterium]